MPTDSRTDQRRANGHGRRRESGPDPDQGADLHAMFFDAVLGRIQAERFPSSEVLDLLQSCMAEGDREKIARVLLDKLSDTRYPSPAMLCRIAQLVG